MTTDTTLLKTIAKDSPKLLEAARLHESHGTLWRGATEVNSLTAAALLRDAIVMELWEKEGVELTIPNRDITAYRVRSARRMDFDNLKDTPLAALYAAWLAKGEA